MPAATTTNKEKQVSTKLEFIPIAKIVANGDNPRTTVDDVALEELTLSILEHGVLQPVLVQPNGGGKFHLVAGSRRFAAAKAAKLKEIPAQVMAVDSSLTAALTENLQRLDLTPLEEAEALHALQQETGESARAIAKRIGKSNDYVSDRLRLVKLPGPIKDAVAAGTVTLHSVPAIARLAEAAPKTAEALIEQVAGDSANYSPRDLEDSGMFLEALGEAMNDVKQDELWRLSSVDVSKLPTDDAAELAERFKKARQATHGYGDRFLYFDADDVDAARAFGCLFTVEDTDFNGAKREVDYATDAAWLADRVRLKVEYAESEAAKKSGGKSPADGVAAGDESDSVDAKEQRRKEREKEEKARVTARGHNLELGVKLAKAFKAPKLTADNVRLVAELALEGRMEAAFRGMRYVDERLQTVETLKSGKHKITYANLPAASKLLREDLDKAKTPEEIIGVVIKAIAAAHYASQEVVAQSSRSYWHVPGISSYSTGPLKKLLTKIAEKHVPPALKKGAGR